MKRHHDPKARMQINLPLTKLSSGRRRSQGHPIKDSR